METKFCKVFGDYVITGIKNAFNNRTSYWISKKGYTVALYCFTPICDTDLANQLLRIDDYIDYFDRYIANLKGVRPPW